MEEQKKTKKTQNKT